MNSRRHGREWICTWARTVGNFCSIHHAGHFRSSPVWSVDEGTPLFSSEFRNPILSIEKAKRYLSRVERKNWNQRESQKWFQKRTYVQGDFALVPRKYFPAPRAITGACPELLFIALCTTALPQMARASVLRGTGRSSDEGASGMVCADGRRASARRLLAHLVCFARRKFPH